MVDINLFKEDEEKEWQPDSEGNENESQDTFDDDLGFDDTLDGDEDVEREEAPSDNEDFLGEDEAIPEFDDEEDDIEAEDLDQELDYDYGEAKDKKAPVWLWIVLILVVLGAGFYLFVYPKMTPPISTDIPRQQEISQTKKTPGIKPDSTKADSAAAATLSQIQQQTTTIKDPSAQTRPARFIQSNNAALISVSETIFNNLAQQNQFGAMLISENQFMIQYASETAGVAQAMGHRIKTLIGVSEIKISPEDRNVKGNRVRYEGVISGTLPDKTYRVSNPVVKQYANARSFEQDIRGMLSQYKLKIQSIQKLSATSEGEPVRIKAEGSRPNILGFMNSLKNIQGNLHMEKLFLSPASHTDFDAENVKLVLDFVVAKN